MKISSLDDGIYKVKGQCIIGGNNTTVQSSADDVLYLVSHDADTSSTTITKMQGKSITLYFIQQDGEYTTDRYVTESWINEKNFASADSVKEYVSNIIGHIGNELSLILSVFVQLVCHVIQGVGKISHLIFRIYGDRVGKISVGKFQGTL